MINFENQSSGAERQSPHEVLKNKSLQRAQELLEGLREEGLESQELIQVVKTELVRIDDITDPQERNGERFYAEELAQLLTVLQAELEAARARALYPNAAAMNAHGH